MTICYYARLGGGDPGPLKRRLLMLSETLRHEPPPLPSPVSLGGDNIYAFDGNTAATASAEDAVARFTRRFISRLLPALPRAAWPIGLGPQKAQRLRRGSPIGITRANRGPYPFPQQRSLPHLRTPPP